MALTEAQVVILLGFFLVSLFSIQVTLDKGLTERWKMVEDGGNRWKMVENGGILAD